MRLKEVSVYQMILTGIIVDALKKPKSEIVIKISPLKWKMWSKLFAKFESMLDVIDVKFNICKFVGALKFDNGSEVKFVVATDECSYKGMSPDMVYIDDAENVDERLINELKARSKVVLMS